MKRLDEQRYQQLLVTGHCNSDENEISGVDNLGHVIRLDSLQREIDLKDDFITFLKLHKNITSFKPNLIHTHTFKAGLLARLPFLVKPKKDIMLIHHYHGHLIEGYFGNIKKFIYLGIERILANRTDLILTDGDKVAKDLISAGVGSEAKFQTITPGVEEPNSEIHPRIETQREVIVGFVGRFTQIKRPDKFISVVEQIYELNPTIKFRMYGDGDLRSQIQLEVVQKQLPVEVFNFAPTAYEVLSEIDILLITSDNEGTPLTVMEASFVGVPCISTDVGAISEIIKNNVNGVVVDNSVDSLAHATLELASDRTLLEFLSRSSVDYAKKNFSMSRYVDQMELIYEDLIKNGSSK